MMKDVFEPCPLHPVRSSYILGLIVFWTYL
jgi:hypothetical protein